MPVEEQPGVLLRRELVLDRPVRRATLSATAHGIYELEVNGGAVGDQVLAILKGYSFVNMFIWFTYRDDSGNAWKSGIVDNADARKPGWNAMRPTGWSSATR